VSARDATGLRPTSGRYSPCRRTACRSGRGSALGPAWCHCRGLVLLRCPTGQGDDLIVGVEDEVQLEAEEPAHLAALGQTGEDLVPVDAMIVARAVESM
jgi:hypothetical protein